MILKGLKLKKEIPPVPKQTGAVHIVTTTGEVLPYSTLERYRVMKSEGGVESKQKDVAPDEFIDNEIVAAKPYLQENFITLWESNTTYFRTVNQIAVDVAGSGWNLILRKGKSEKTSEIPKIEHLLAHPNPDDSLHKIFTSMVVDWGVTGCMALEISKGKHSKVGGIYHVPAHTIWVSKDKKKYVQRKDNKFTWLKRFGLDTDITVESGEPVKEGEEATNSLIFLTPLYFPLSDYYTVPQILPSIGSLMGLIEIRDYNLAFFANHGIPAYVVMLSGDWEEGSEDKITNYLRAETKGSVNSQKTMVVTLPEGGELTFEPLSVKEREGSFRIFNQVWKEDVLSAYSMPPYRVGIMPMSSRLGSGAEAEEMTEIYKQGVIEPLQTVLEDMLNFKILDSMGLSSYSFKFTDLDTRDFHKDAETYGNLVEQGIMLRNEARQLLNLGDDLPGGDVPYISGFAELESTKTKHKAAQLLKIIGE